ncbi:arginine-binding extracellular protein ArtP precursor [Andreesenia angusta]|uniref:Arginine-binding extracellular protein ArtP n=1 Tax=Andreesenia angusta TaxID=39480 RepID=A0A1S1V8B6_9FIRM|nr:transporter substrate-binding domain-containing protein [Andreesenia angusta]OHW62838.1 arginine-binding extracellular protein ArtP precursor [Andreesenia angusta]
MFNKRIKQIAAFSLVAVMGLFAFTGCGSKDDDKIVLGTSADYPPFEFMDTEQNILGFDLMIAEEIAKDMGKELEVKNMEFNSLLTALQTDKIDMILSGMNPDEERRKTVDFSEIYYLSKHYVVVNADKADSIKKEADLNGKKIGVQIGTTQEKLAREKFPGSEIVALGSIQDILLQLKTNKLDAAITEDAVAKNAVNSNKDLVLPGIEYEDEEGGVAVAVRKDSPELVEQINKTIKRLQDENKIEEFFDEAVRLSSENE